MRTALVAVAALLLSVSGGTEGRDDSLRSFSYSDWQTQGEAVDFDSGRQRVGSFTVGKPAAERFVGDLFEEWRDVVAPEFGGFDRSVRETVRDKLFFNRETVDFNDYLRERREDVLLRLNQGSADFLSDRLVRHAEGEAEGLSFVRRIDLSYQSSIGERRWQSGIDVLGPLRERPDHVVAWQMRAFAAEGNSAGANFGLIYRHVAGEENLAGVNAFLDYEDHEYGDFWRWSYGGELRGPWGGIYANHYLALTNERNLGDGYVAYSQSGMDVAAEISPPGLRWFTGGLTYYHWQGQHEDDDRGLRYHTGFEFAKLFGGGDFWGGLSFDVEYDHPESGDGDWGWRLAYTHRFGTPTAGGESVTTDDFDPRSMFFDPVRREYAQRIRKVRVGTSAMVSVVFGNGSVNGAEIATGGSRTFLLDEQSTVVAHATSTLEIAASPSKPWTITVYGDTTLAFREKGKAVDLIQGGFLFTRDSGAVGGGVGDVSLLSSPNLTVKIFGTRAEMWHPYENNRTRVDLHEGVFLITIAGGMIDNLRLSGSRNVTVTAIAQDATVVVQGREFVLNSFVSHAASVSRKVLMGFSSGDLYTLTPTGGEPASYTYALLNAPDDWTISDRGVIAKPTPVIHTTTLTAQINDNFGQPAQVIVGFQALASISSSSSGGEFYVGAGYAGPIASLSLGLSGDDPDEPYGRELINSSSASLALSDSDELRAVSGFPAPATVVVTARFSGNLGSFVDVPFTLFGVPRLNLSPSPPTGRNVRLSGDAAFFTLAVSGGRPPYRFSASGPLSVNAAGVVAVRRGDDADIGSARGSVFVENGVVVIGGNRLATVVAFNYYKPIHYAPASVTVEAAASVTVAQNVHVATVGGGLPGGTTTYSAVSTEPSTVVVSVDGNSGQVRLASKLSLEAFVTVRIRATQGDDVATLVLVIKGVDRPIVQGLRAFYPVPQGTVAVTLTTLNILGNFPPYAVGFAGGDAAARFRTVVDGGNTVVVFDGDNTPGVRTSELRITDKRATVTSAYNIVVSVFAPLSFPTESPVRVADDYVGFIGAYPAENGYGTRRYSTATDGASVGETDARLSLTTALGNTNLPVTIVAQDDTNVTAFLTVELQSVPGLTLTVTAVLSVLYVPVGAAPNAPLLTMEATGGDGTSVTYTVQASGDSAGWVFFDDDVLKVEAAPDAAMLGTIVVRGTDGAVGNEDAVTVTVQFYEGISFLSNPVTQSVPKDLAVVVHDIEARGGSGAYDYSVVTVVDAAGRGIAVSVDDSGGVSLAAPMATTMPMSVVVEVRDSNIPSAMALLTVVVEGADGLFVRTANLRHTARRYYVSSEVATPYAVVSLIAVGGVTPYRWGLAAGEDADGLLAFGTGGTLTTVNVRAQPTSLRAESFVLTVGETTGTLAASVTLTMEFYAPLSVALPMGSQVIPEENFVGTLTVAKIHDGTAGDVDVRPQVTAIGGRFEDYFDAPVVGEAVVDSNGRRYRPVGLEVKQVLPHTLTAFVTLVVLDRADGRRRMVAVTVRGKIPFTQSKPLGLHTVPGGAPIRANEPTVGITVLLDLDGYFKGGERPYTYIIDGRNLEVSSENELIYNGGGLLDTRGTATVVASDADGDSVTAALTLAFSIPVGFVPATVTQTIAAGYVGAVYAAAARGSHDPIAWINDKLWVGTRVLDRAYGEFDYSIVTPAYDTAGRAVPVSSSRQTVSLGQGLAAGSRLTVTVVAQGAVLRNNPWRASLDLILVAAPAPSATLSAWFTQLLTGEGNRVVASLHTSGYPDPVVSLVAGGDAFAYLAGTRLLSVSVTRSSAASESATLEVSDRGLGWPAVRVTHTLGWVSSGVAAADLSLAGTLEAAHAIPVAATAPMALGTLSVSGGRGSYSAVVRQTGGALAVDLNGGVAVVRLVSVGASGTEIRATLAVDDGIPGGAVERVITVLFYAPAAYAPSLVTVDVAAQALLWQRAYAVPATGGFGEGFRYSVLTVVGDKPVSVDMERGVVWLDTDDGGRLGSGKTLTAEIEATDVRVESNRAVLTVVMAGSIFPTFSEFDVQDGSRLVYFIKVGTTALVRQGLGVRGGGSPVVTMESAAAENYEHKVGGILSLTVAQDSPTVHRLTIHTYDSGQPAATRITVSRVLTVVIHDPLQGVAQPFLFVARTLPAGASVGMATVGGGGGSVTWSKAGGDANNLLTVRSDGRIGLVRQPTSGVGRGFYLEVQKVIRAEDEAGDSQTATVNVQFHRPLRWGNASRLRVIAGESVRSIDVPTDIGTHALFDFSNGARGGFDLSSTVRVIEAALTQHLTTPPFNIELEDGPGNLRIIPTSSNERVDHEARSRMRWSVNPINSYIKFEVVSWYTDFTGTRVTARATFRSIARGPVSLVSPLGSRNLLAGTAITQTVIADLSSHLHGGLPTYRGVADDAALTVSAGALLYVGGARAAGSVLTVTMALSDYLVAGHVNATVRTGVTMRFRPAVSFDAATVTKRIGAGFVGAVFAPTVSGGSDSFSFTMTQPVYGDGGRTVTAGIAGGTVTLGTSLAVDERATMTVAVTDATGGAMASLLVVLEAAAVTAAVTGYYDSLSVGDNRPVAGVSVSGFEGVSVRVEGGGGVFRYVPGTTPDEGGFLWGSSGESVEAMATLVVGSRLLGWPEVTLGYAAGWSAVGNLFLIGGSGQATDGGALLARADVWYSSNGSSWTRRCENCFGVADVRGHSAASYRGSLWVVGGVGDFRVYRSADGRVWDTVMSLPGSLPDRNHQLVAHQGTLWLIGGAYEIRGASNQMYYYSEAGGTPRFVSRSLGPNEIGPLDGHAAVLGSNGNIYLYGGGTKGHSNADAFPGLFDGSWRGDAINTQIPPNRVGTQIAFLGVSMFVYGGNNNGDVDVAAEDVVVFIDRAGTDNDGLGTAVDESAAGTLFGGGRSEHQMFSFDDQLWLVGGRETTVGVSPPALKGDIWNSGDGENWTLAVAAADFGRRQEHVVVVHESAGADTPVTRFGIDSDLLGNLHVVAAGSTVTDNAILVGLPGSGFSAVKGHVGEVSVSVIAGGDARFSWSVDTSKLLRVPFAPNGNEQAGSVIVVTVRFTDETPFNVYDHEFRVSFYAPVSFSEATVRVDLPSSVPADGAVYTLTTRDGLPWNREYSVVSPFYYRGGEATLSVAVGSKSGVMTVPQVLDGNYLYDVMTVTAVAADSTVAADMATLIVEFNVARVEFRNPSSEVLVGTAAGTRVAQLAFSVAGLTSAIESIASADGDWLGVSLDATRRRVPVTLKGPLASAGVYRATIVVSTRANPRLPFTTLAYTLRAVAGVSSVEGATVTAVGDYAGALVTVSSVMGGVSPYSFALARAVSGYSIGEDGAVSVAAGSVPGGGEQVTLMVSVGGNSGSSGTATVVVAGARELSLPTLFDPIPVAFGTIKALYTLGGTVSGGAGAFSYSSDVYWVTVDAAGVVSMAAGRFLPENDEETETLEETVRIEVTDEALGRTPAVFSLTVRSYFPVHYDRTSPSVPVPAFVDGVQLLAYRPIAQGGAGFGFNYSLDSVVPPRFVVSVHPTDARFFVGTRMLLLSFDSVTAVVRATDRKTGESAVQTVAFWGSYRPVLKGVEEDRYYVATGATAPITLATVSVSGGVGKFADSTTIDLFAPDGYALTDGRLLLTTTTTLTPTLHTVTLELYPITDDPNEFDVLGYCDQSRVDSGGQCYQRVLEISIYAPLSVMTPAAVTKRFGADSPLLTRLQAAGGVAPYAWRKVGGDPMGLVTVTRGGTVAVVNFPMEGADLAVTVAVDGVTGTGATVVLTVRLVAPLAFPAQATKRVAIGYVGEVFEAPTATGGGGGYSYGVVTPAYKSDGTAVPLLGDRTVIMGGDGLMAGERLTASVVVTDAEGEKATMTLVLEAGTVGTTVSLSSWFVSLRVDNRDLAVASVAATGFPGVTMRLVEGTGVYSLEEDGALWTRMSPSDGGDAVAVVEVANAERLGFPVFRVTHTVTWVRVSGGERPRAGIYAVGGVAGGNAMGDVWYGDGGGWERLCDGCFVDGTVTVAQQGHDVALHGGSLWVISGSGNKKVWRSANGSDWEAVGDYRGSQDRGFRLISPPFSSATGPYAFGGITDVADLRTNLFYFWGNDEYRSSQPLGSDGRADAMAASLNGTLWIAGGNGSGGNLADVWSVLEGSGTVSLAVAQVTATAAFGGRANGGMAAHNGTLFLIGGKSTMETGTPRIWHSTDGRSWDSTRIGSDTPFDEGDISQVQLLSFQGFLGLMGVGAMGDNYFSSTGAGWFKSATPDYGVRTGMRMVVNARYSPFDPDFARAGISLSVVAAVERQFVATVGTPRVLLTVSVYGAVGDFALQAVSAEAGVFEVSDAGVVRVTGSGTIGEVAVTVRATDATGNWDEVVARVSFVGPLAFPAGRVTKRIAIGYVGAVFEAPTAMGGGDGGYSYTVVTPAYKSDGTAVAMSLDGRTLIMGGDGLAAGELLTASVVVTDAAGEKATMTLVLEAGTVGLSVGLSVWFVSLRVDNRDLAVASVAATGFPSVTMRLVEGTGVYSVEEDGGLWARMSPSDGGDAVAVVEVANAGRVGFPVFRVTHTVTWVRVSGEGLRPGLYAVGGVAGNTAKGDVWYSGDGGSWERLCDACFVHQGATVLQGNPALQGVFDVAVHGGSLWVVRGRSGRGDAGNRSIFRSANGRNWEYVGIYAGSELLAFRVISPPFSSATGPYVFGGHDGTVPGSKFYFWGNGGFRSSQSLGAGIGRANAMAASLNGTLWIAGGTGRTGSRKKADVWSVLEGAGTVSLTVAQVTAAAAFGARANGGMAAHNGTLFLIGGKSTMETGRPRIWHSTDGRSWDWTEIGSDTSFDEGDVSDVQLFSHGGNLWLMGVGAMGDNYYSSNGAAWSKADAPGYGVRTGMRVAASMPPFARVGISLSVATVERRFVATAGTPRVLLTVSVYGAVGDFALQAVSAEAGVFEVSDAGVVRVTGSGTIGEVAFVTVRATDATGNWDEVVARVLFVAGAPSARIEAYYRVLPLGEENRAVASVSLSGYYQPTVQIAGDDGYEYVPAANPQDGGVLRAKVTPTTPGDTRNALLLVTESSEFKDLLPGGAAGSFFLRHTVTWGRGAMYVIGGRNEETTVAMNDVWRSMDGVRWERLCSSCFSGGAPVEHDVVSFGGSLWVFPGGSDGGFYRSRDGRSWQRFATAGLAFNAGRGVAVHGDTIWSVGGRKTADGSYGSHDSVFRYDSGQNRFVGVAASTAAIFAARENAMVGSIAGSLWVFAGNDGGGVKNDSWASADGVSWTRVIANNEFIDVNRAALAVHQEQLYIVGGEATGRAFRSGNGANWAGLGVIRDIPTGSGVGMNLPHKARHGMVSYGRSLWMAGGRQGAADAGQVWNSDNGSGWNLVVATAAFGRRSDLQFVVHDDGGGERPPMTTMRVAGVDPRLSYLNKYTVSVANALVPLTTLSVSGGSGGYRFELMDDRGVAELVDGDGGGKVLRVLPQSKPIPRLGFTLRVGDSSPDNWVELLFEVVFDIGKLTFYQPLVTQTVAAGQIGGEVYYQRPVTRSGDDPETYSISSPVMSSNGRMIAAVVNRSTVFAGDVYMISGPVVLSTPLADGERAVFTVVATDDSERATLVLHLAGATAGAELVRMAGTVRLDDVDLAVASVRFAGYPSPQVAVVEGGEFFGYEDGVLRATGMISGGTGTVAVLEVTDAGLGWPVIRVTHSVVWGAGGMYLIGGWVQDLFAPENNVYYDDVWHSADGVDWRRICDDCFGTVQYDGAATFYQGSLWVVGGRENSGVYRSATGLEWEEVVADSGLPEGNQGLVVHQGTLWVVGGVNHVAGTYHKSMYYYSEADSAFVATTDFVFSRELNNYAVSFRGSIWSVGSDADPADVWASGDGVNWERVADEVAMGRRVGGDIFVRGDWLYFYGGIRSGGIPAADNVVWSSRDGLRWTKATGNPFGGNPGSNVELAVYGGAVWLIGGEANNAKLTAIWWSGDGGDSWRSVEARGILPRKGHQVLVYE